MPREVAVLREVVRRLTAVFKATGEVVGRAEAFNRQRGSETASIAEVLSRVDPAAGRRVMAARRSAAAAELRAAHALADEMRYQAGTHALAAVERYAGTLAAAAHEKNAARTADLASLGAVLARMDRASAIALQESMERSRAGLVASAEQQAMAFAAQIQAAIGSLPKPAAELGVGRSSRAYRRRSKRRVERGVLGGEAADVVVLDPGRRRRAN